ncbi:MAG: hypothetical protein ACRDTF_16335, partial [Pseudonocardiaceae bacterium]
FALLPCPGQDGTLNVPEIASEGSILVSKGDPLVTVGYVDPQGTEVPTNGELGISHFELSGQGSEVEALRIVNPTPGQWTVRLSSPPGVPAQDVSARAIFQGAIRAKLSVLPLTPRPGSEVDLTMQVRGARAAITDPAQLRGLTFVGKLHGDGFPPVPPIELADGDGDGQYQGRLTVPNMATGRLDFFGGVTGIGVSGDQQSVTTRIASGADVQGVLTLDGVDADVVVGTSLNGTAQVMNSTGQPRTLRIEIVESSPGAVITVEPRQLTVPASGQAVLPLTVRFDPATTLGSNQARLRLVDESDGALVGQLLFARNVVPEPGIIERLWWLWLLLAVALVGSVAGVVWRLRRRRAGRDVHGVRVELRRHGQPLGSPVRAHRHAEEFRFGIRRGGGAADTSLTTGPGGDRYRVRRSPSGPALSGPSGEPVDLAPGGVLDLDEGLELILHDRSAAGRPPRPVPGPASAGSRDGRSRVTPDPYDL